MKTRFLQKLEILMKSRKIFKNWYMIPSVFLKISKNDFMIFETRNGLKIKIRVDSTDLMALTNVWINEEYFRDKDFEEDSCIIDVGAHIGIFALYVSQFCKDGRIFCFEPVKENYDLLISNLKMNKVKNIIPINAAISKNNGIVKIFLDDDEAGHSILKESDVFQETESITVEKFFEEKDVKKCNLLKLDCEGAEYEIIESLNDMTLEKIDEIILEYHFVKSKQDLFKKLIEKLEQSSMKTKYDKSLNDMGILTAKRE